MMISLTDTGSPAETAAAQTLLAIIADPAVAQKRLDELRCEKQLSLDAMENARRASSEAATKLAASEANLTQAKLISAEIEARSQRVADQEAAIKTRQQQINAADDELSARAAAWTASMTAREKALSQREEDVSAREADANAREASVIAAQNQIEAVKADYEARLAKLREAVGEKP